MDPARSTHRIAFAGRLLVRGTCGQFAALGEDISRSGLRLALRADVLRLDPEADLAAAAACVQTRVGSRFALDLGLTAAGRGRVRKTVQLVRLVIEETEEGILGLGCQFDEPLTHAEAKDLGLEFPADGDAAEDGIRSQELWTEGGRAALDPKLAEEKVESLLGVPAAMRSGSGDLTPGRPLRALVRTAEGGGAAPLVGLANGFTEVTVRMRISEQEVRRIGAEPGDFPALARGMRAAYGEWPDMEILDGTRRVWRGVAHPCGFEFDVSGDRGAVLRLAFARRLQPMELKKLCA